MLLFDPIFDFINSNWLFQIIFYLGWVAAPIVTAVMVINDDGMVDNGRIIAIVLATLLGFLWPFWVLYQIAFWFGFLVLYAVREAIILKRNYL